MCDRANTSSNVAFPLALARQAPRPPSARAPLVVLLHGHGADERDLMPLVRDLPHHLSYVSPRGPLAVDGGGSTWFTFRAAARPEPASLRAAVATLRAWLDGTPEFARAPTFLLGFSAGMMLAGALLLDDPRRFAGALLLSGALSLDAQSPATAGRLTGIPVFLAHGTRDDVIPAKLVASTRAYLQGRSGAALTVREYPHAHDISRRETADIAAWLNAHT